MIFTKPDLGFSINFPFCLFAVVANRHGIRVFINTGPPPGLAPRWQHLRVIGIFGTPPRPRHFAALVDMNSWSPKDHTIQGRPHIN